jgi:hypothetical protein
VKSVGACLGFVDFGQNLSNVFVALLRLAGGVLCVAARPEFGSFGLGIFHVFPCSLELCLELGQEGVGARTGFRGLHGAA